MSAGLIVGLGMEGVGIGDWVALRWRGRGKGGIAYVRPVERLTPARKAETRKGLVGGWEGEGMGDGGVVLRTASKA